MPSGRAVLALAILVLATLPALPGASAASSVDGCSKLTHNSVVNPSHRTDFRVSVDTSSVNGACSPVVFELLAAHCVTVNISYQRQGVSAPTTPSFWEVYWYYDTVESDHGASGNSNWASYTAVRRYTSAPPADSTLSTQFCATTTGESGDEARAGSYRLVLRECLKSGAGDTCSSGANSYDVNSDANAACSCQGTPGAGFSVTANYGNFQALDNPNIKDPLWVMSNLTTFLGAPVNLTIKSEYDNGTARLGGAGNITVFVEAPDGSFVVTNQTVTETTYPGDRPHKGFYHYSFTPTQTGRYIVTAQSITSDNQPRTSKPWTFQVFTPPVGDLSMSVAYSWDTHHALVTARVVDANGTARTGLASLLVARLFAPDGTPLAAAAFTNGNMPGTYASSTYLGVDPQLGTWSAYLTAPAEGNGGGNLTASSTLVVPLNLTAKLDDLRSLMVDLGAWMNASFAFTDANVNATSAYTDANVNATSAYTDANVNATSAYTDANVNATSAYTDANVNATSAYANALRNASRALDEGNFTSIDENLSQIDEALDEIADGLDAFAANNAPTVSFVVLGELGGPAPGVYAGRAAKFTATATSSATFGALLYQWDFGDNTTAEGPTVYHTYAGRGNYSVRVVVLSAMGNSTNATQALTVNESTPVANVTGPVVATQFERVVYDARASVDPYDRITAYEWTVNPASVDGGFLFGIVRANAGYGTGNLFNYTWTLTGNQTIRLNVTNSHGHTTSIFYNVTVTDPYHIQDGNAVPTADLSGTIATTTENGVSRLTGFLQWVNRVFGPGS